MDSGYLEAGDSDVTGTGMGTMYHELYHAYLLIVAGTEDPQVHHSFINGIEDGDDYEKTTERWERGEKRKRVHKNLKSLIDQWKKCREKCRR